MQKGEYCEVFVYDNSSVTFFQPNPLNLIELKKDKSMGDRTDRDAARRYIAHLGLEGLEMVGRLTGDAQIMFKRPI